MSLISRLSNLIASIRQSELLHGDEPHFRLGGWPAYCYQVRLGHTLDVTSRKKMYSVYKVPSHKA